MKKPERSLGRHEVLAFACTLSMITYLDRVCFGTAASLLVQDLGLKGDSDLKWAFTAFAFAYAWFEIPSGWLGDAFGPKRTLIRIVIGWSIFTALTGLVGLKVGTLTLGGLGLLCLIRFLFGMAEAGAYPNLARVVANWFPAEERGRAKGWIWMSGRFMGGATPLIWTLLVAGSAFTAPLVSWRLAFVLFGTIGLVWCLAFSRRFKDHPVMPDGPVMPAGPVMPDGHALDHSTSKPVAAATLVVLAKGGHVLPWRLLLTTRSTWLLGLMYCCASFSWYFNITYISRYLETQHGVASTSISGAILKGGAISGWTIGTILEMSVASHAAAEQVEVAALTNAAKQAALSNGYVCVFVAFTAVSFIAMLAWLFVNPEQPLEESHV